MTTHEPEKINGYSESEINGHAYVTVTHIPDHEKYRGYYPQGKVSNLEFNQAVLTTHSESLSLNNNTQWTVAYLHGVKYEKVGDKYFKYELVELEESMLADHKTEMWSKKKIDMSIYHELGNEHNIYSRSYIREYIEIVMRKKMVLRKNDQIYLSKVKGFASASLAHLRHYLIKVGVFNAAQNDITNAENTDYAKEVESSYSTMRGIDKNTYDHIDLEGVWTATYVTDLYLQPLKYEYVFHKGSLWQAEVNRVYGLRPVIELEA